MCVPQTLFLCGGAPLYETLVIGSSKFPLQGGDAGYSNFRLQHSAVL